MKREPTQARSQLGDRFDVGFLVVGTLVPDMALLVVT